MTRIHIKMNKQITKQKKNKIKCKDCNYDLNDGEPYVFDGENYYCLEPCYQSKLNELRF